MVGFTRWEYNCVINRKSSGQEHGNAMDATLSGLEFRGIRFWGVSKVQKPQRVNQSPLHPGFNNMHKCSSATSFLRLRPNHRASTIP